MCRLSQISGRDSYKLISSRVSSFAHTFFPVMFAVLLSTHALNYTDFPGVVQVAAESECGASLHGYMKCSQAGCPLVNGHLGESALEGGYTQQSASPHKQRGTRAIFTLTCNPALMLGRNSLKSGLELSVIYRCYIWVLCYIQVLLTDVN